MRDVTSARSCVATSLTARCPFRSDSHPVSPTAAKVWRAKGTTRMMRIGIFLDIFKIESVRYRIGILKQNYEEPTTFRENTT